MTDEVLALFARHGCVRRRRLVKAGLTRKRIARLVDAGELRLLAPDVLALPGPPAVDEDLRAAAAALGAVVSGQQAALVRGWAMVSAPDEFVLTVARNRGSARRPGVDVRRRDIDPREVMEIDGMPIVSSIQSILDCCRDLPLREAVVIADSALRERDVTVAELHAALVALPAGRGRDRVARVVQLVDPLSGSVLETLCRLLLVDAGLPPEDTQLLLRRGRQRIGRVDFAYLSARLVVEVDGFAFHADRKGFREDRRRDNAIVRSGWAVLRFSWEDVVGSPAYVVACVRDALAASAARVAAPAA